MEAVLAIISGKWKFMILWALANNKTQRFSELRRSIHGISEKMLIQELKELQLDGIVSRKDFGEVPPRVEYSLSPFGIELAHTLEPLCQWGTKYMARIGSLPSQIAAE
ncbi:hypothetical protein GCM10008941_24060 [Rhizomicrobium palustre]